MAQQEYVFDAELVGFDDVRRTIAVRSDLTLVDLHYALQSAFGWDDDHLYAFWVGGQFWTNADEHFKHPCAGDELVDPAERSAAVSLESLGLDAGRSLAYVFDFEDEWRVRLHVRDVIAGEGSPSPRLVRTVGRAPLQYAHTAA
jgi:Plasmid pRiA4b ORF-3-like protein